MKERNTNAALWFSVGMFALWIVTLVMSARSCNHDLASIRPEESPAPTVPVDVARAIELQDMAGKAKWLPEAEFEEFTRLLHSDSETVRVLALDVAATQTAEGDHKDYLEMVAIRNIRYGQSGLIRGRALHMLYRLNASRARTVIEVSRGHNPSTLDTDAVLAGMALATDRDEYVKSTVYFLDVTQKLGMEK